MENKAHALVAGLFVLLLAAVTAAAIVWFRGDHIERRGYTVVAQGGVAGLAVKAAVKLRGVDVGSVESIAFDPSDPRRILVRIVVDTAAPLTRGTYAQLGYQGVTGLSFIDLSDRGNDLRPLAQAPEAERRIELKPSLFDQLATGGPALLAALAETAERINSTLSAPNQERLQRLLDSSAEAMTQVAQRADSLKPAIAAIQPAVQQLGRTAQRAEATLQRLDGVVDETALLAKDVRARLPLLDRAGDAAGRIEAAARAFEVGLVGFDAAPTPPLLDTLGRAGRSVDRAAAGLSEQPQSLIFGRAPAAPGPGESGFAATGAAR